MKRLLILAAALLAVHLAPASAHAIGVGFYFSSASGDSDIDTGPYWWGFYNSDSYWHSNDADLKESGGGLVLDTNVSGESLFNYRLELGKQGYKWEHRDGTKTELDGTSMSHDFGFGLFRNDKVRFWIGPEIRVTKINDSTGGEDYDMLGFGVGVVLGLNINLAGPVTLGLKAGAMNQTMNGDITYIGPFGRPVKDDISSDDSFSFATVAVIFRLGEE